MGWILSNANANKNANALNMFIRAKTPMSSRLAIEERCEEEDEVFLLVRRNSCVGFGVVCLQWESVATKDILGEVVTTCERSQVQFLCVFLQVITEYLVNIRKRRAFWSLNEDILKNNSSDYQYAVSIKEDTTYMCLHSPKTTMETRSIRCIQRRPIRRIEGIVCEDSERYQTWSLLQETLNTPYPTH
ncbi:hypothetical protein Tco_0764785 [Tanacetum coccineum]